ncbi:hypothetical protein BBK36DRAFT_1101590, partial [Trichoderma citrinoviride]
NGGYPNGGYPNGGSPNGGSPNGGTNGDPDGNSYGYPSGNPQSSAAGLPANLPGSAPDMSTCLLQAITTVFVTVYPTSHSTPSGLPQPNDFDPDHTAHQTAFPTTPGVISSAQSVEAAQTSVKPFTTITIDVWGDDPESLDSFTSDVPSVPVYTDGASDPVATSADFPAGSPTNTEGSWPNNSPLPTPSDAQASLTAGPVVGTPAPENSAYGGASGFPSGLPSGFPSGIPSGPSQTLGQQPSEYTSPSGTDTGAEGGQPVQVTVIGADGNPTVLEFPGGEPTNGNNNGAGQPFPTAATALPGFTSGPAPAASQVFPAAGQTTCTSYTVLGPNGVPTVVHSTWVNSPTDTAGLPSGFPSGFTSGLPVVTGLPGGPVIATHTAFTVLGPDGLPTVVESSWLVPAPTQSGVGGIPNQVTGFPNQVSGFPTQVTGSAAAASVGGSPTCTSYTVLGMDGLPTVVETTWIVPRPTAGANPANVVTGVPSQFGGGGSGDPSQPATDGGVNAVTACTSYTVLGSDGAPTVVESTFVVYPSNALPTVTNALPLPPAQASGFPQGVSGLPQGDNLATTCITVGVVGPDGSITPVVQTVVVPTGAMSNALPVQTNPGYPSLVPAQNGLPQGQLSATPAGSGLFTTCITLTTVGPDGLATPVVQTVVGLPSGTELGSSLPVSTGALPFPNSQVSNGGLTNLPTLGQYGSLQSGLPSLLPPSAAESGIVGPTGTVTGTRTSTLTVVNGPGGQPATLVPYSDDWSNQAPVLESSGLSGNAYGSPSRLATALQTSTWTNVIPEDTTTYTINFPLTTMATVALPNRRAMRRQQDSPISSVAPDNSTLSTTPIPTFSTQSAFVPSLPSMTFPAPPQVSSVDGSGSSPMCPTGGKIGNFTLNFDDTKTGPLFNPSRDIWFSEGFLIAPPSSQTFQSYSPSSGGQLVEFVPPSLPSLGHSGVGDTAEIGVGPNAPNHCFRFDFQGASLGCAAEGAEQWCEFEVSAYRYNDVLQREESVAWSETKRIPACPNFPHGSCQLTPVTFDGYANITAVLISLRVGTELRVWWGDDFKLGWSDNGCDAAACRASAVPQPVKREVIESAARRGVWNWTPNGLKRLDDGYIWESL